MNNFFTTILRGRGRNDAEPEAAPESGPEAVPAPVYGEEWGIPPEMLTAAYDANEYFFGDRAQTLDYRGSFFYARQHDRRPFDMNGVALAGLPSRTFPGAQPFLAQSGLERYVPLAQRRPSNPYRIARTIVTAFTGMLFGVQRWPKVTSDDPATQAFCEELVRAAKFPYVFSRGRNAAGAQGTVCFSWQFREGLPKLRMHIARFVTVLEWEDPDDLIPRHVTELYQSKASRRAKDGGVERYDVWIRKDWTPIADVVFKPVEAIPGQNPDQWIIDEERSYPHGDKECHFVWVPNIPDDEDPSAIDGQPDYAELYEPMNSIDETNSVLDKGTNANLDPTLHIKRENPESVKVIRKGSENAIVTEPSGDAKYLTLEGGVVEAGERLVNMKRAQVLEVAQCIVADPDAVAAAGTSSLTMRLVYAPMISSSDLRRETFGCAIKRLLEQMHRSASRLMYGEAPTTEGEPEIPEEVDDEQPQDVLESDEIDDPMQVEPPVVVQHVLRLKPVVVTEEEIGADGKPTGKVKVISTKPQEPGHGSIELTWGEYFPPTSDDKQKVMTTNVTAAGSKPIVSQRTAVELTAQALGKDPAQEWMRVTDEAQRARFDAGGAGGGIDDFDGPTNVEGQPSTAAPDDVQKTALNGAQIASLVEVVTQVAKGELPRESAVQIVAASLNISDAEAAKIIGPAGEEETPTESRASVEE